MRSISPRGAHPHPRSRTWKKPPSPSKNPRVLASRSHTRACARTPEHEPVRSPSEPGSDHQGHRDRAGTIVGSGVAQWLSLSSRRRFEEPRRSRHLPRGSMGAPRSGSRPWSRPGSRPADRGRQCSGDAVEDRVRMVTGLAVPVAVSAIGTESWPKQAAEDAATARAPRRALRHREDVHGGLLRLDADELAIPERRPREFDPDWLLPAIHSYLVRYRGTHLDDSSCEG